MHTFTEVYGRMHSDSTPSLVQTDSIASFTIETGGQKVSCDVDISQSADGMVM